VTGSSRTSVGLRAAMWVAAVVAVVAAALGTGVRSTYGGQAAVDEPQYLLTALSLWEDPPWQGDSLDISDELAAERWRAYHDAELPMQTEMLTGGRQVSPHDPLLPLLLAVPIGLAGDLGWLAAKLTLAVLAGAVAALAVWVAVRRFGVPSLLAGAGMAVLAASPPLAVYGQQVYPEVPAAGAVLVLVAAGTGPLDRRGLVAAAAALTALPWLSVKYAPVAAVLALLILWRLARAGRSAAVLGLAGGLAVAAAGYLGLHQLWYGGLTVYAAGDHFAETGELSVMGVEPDYAGRSLRLVALLVDNSYGLAAWAPVWLLAVVALAAVARGLVDRAADGPFARPAGMAFLLLPVATGWALATWAAYTMHGFWWPGRQVVAVLPLAGIALLWWLAHLAGPLQRALAAVLAGVGMLATAALLVDGWAREITWVSGFERVDNPLYSWGRALLPDYRVLAGGDWLRHGAWTVVLAALAVAGWRQAGRRRPDVRSDTAPVTPEAAPELTRA